MRRRAAVAVTGSLPPQVASSVIANVSIHIGAYEGAGYQAAAAAGLCYMEIYYKSNRLIQISSGLH